MVRIETRWVERAVGSNRILVYLAGVTLALSTAAGFLMHWIDEEAFPTVGTGVWWAVVTFCTVGYGDYVPTDGVGRVVASIVMVFAITFIAIVTALVTSTLVTQAQKREQEAKDALHPPVLETLAHIEERLERIEHRLSQR
ncbi:MAG: potassium channel family protein [Gaiellaceae bacterium]